MCCLSMLALKSRLKYNSGQTDFHQSEQHWQNYSREIFFKVEDVEMVYISQSDLGTFKGDNSTNNA